MPKTHIVKQGECIASIASKYGLFPDTIWNHAENRPLQDRRKDPYVLLPGDKVYIPDKQAGEASAQTEQRHRFKRKGVPESLKLEFYDEAGDPLADTPYVLDIDGKTERGTTDSQAVIEKSILPDAKKATITFESPDGDENLVFELQLGGIDPIDKESGYRYRLENLGYLDPESKDQSLSDAVRAFQEDHGIAPTGVADSKTQEAIKSEYEG